MESNSCESLGISQGLTIRWKSMEFKSLLFIRNGSQYDQIGLSITGEAVDHQVVLGALIVIEHIEVTKRTRDNS
ncbi:MAG TPA: hypothetical protein VKA09_06965 [Nitrososphaeraceae archaeon]|nr:hypothetical protein [Nitrososphaeraceae archaeon]